jgi:hypothetical protein
VNTARILSGAGLALALWGGLMVSAEAEAAVGPGMGLDEAKEHKLAAATREILGVLDAGKPDYSSVAAKCAEARKLAGELLALAEKTEPVAPDRPAIPEEVPVPVPEGSSLAEARAAWREQLRFRVRAVYEMLTGEILKPLPKWDEVIGVGWRHRKNRAKRAAPTAPALREAQVFALLLAGRSREVRIRAGETLFAEDFSKGTGAWHLYGPGDFTTDENGMRQRNRRPKNADTHTWTRKEFEGNFLFEFDFTPNNGGKGPGTLFSICGRPVKEGTDLSVSCGEEMTVYNFGVHAYHFSMHRGETGICNGRKVGTGLHLIGSRTPDPARETGKTYRVAVGKWGNSVFCVVDGKLQHSYYDAGTFGPPLSGGSCGFRHWGGADATYANVKVSRLVESE